MGGASVADTYVEFLLARNGSVWARSGAVRGAGDGGVFLLDDFCREKFPNQRRGSTQLRALLHMGHFPFSEKIIGVMHAA